MRSSSGLPPAYSQAFSLLEPGSRARTRCALGVLPLSFGESEGDVQAKQQLILAILETHCQHKLPSTGRPPPCQTCCGGSHSPDPNSQILSQAYRVKHKREANSKIKSIKGGMWCNPQAHLPSSGWGRLAGDPTGLSGLRGVTPRQNSHRALPRWAAGTAKCPNHLFKMPQLSLRLRTGHGAKGTERRGSKQCHGQGLEVLNPSPSSPGHDPPRTSMLPQGSGWTAAPCLPAAPLPPPLHALSVAAALPSNDA